MTGDKNYACKDQFIFNQNLNLIVKFTVYCYLYQVVCNQRGINIQKPKTRGGITEI